MILRRGFLFVFWLFTGLSVFSQEYIIRGYVQDDTFKALEFVNVYLKGTAIGTSTDEKCFFSLKVPENKFPGIIIFSFMGYEQEAIKFQKKEVNQLKSLRIKLTKTDNQLSEVTVNSNSLRASNMQSLKPIISGVLPTASSGEVENLIKALPGVVSSNDLSYQYSVRGGNYDENLIYVNDIEIIRPQLIQSGQQEGLSFINSNLVQSIKFAAGGFAAQYGDKMSSVLVIKYQEPSKLHTSFSLSLLGGEIDYKNSFLNHRINWMSSLRYRSTQYLLNSLPEKGDYHPQSADFQNIIYVHMNNNFKLQYMQYLSQNQYNFVPKTRETDFGTIQQAYNIKIYFDGQENDKFLSLLNSLKLSYLKDKFQSNFIISAYNNKEHVGQDIWAEYFLNELDKQLGSETLGDSLFNLGTGTSLNHIKNTLFSNVYNTEYKAKWLNENWKIEGGLSYRRERFYYQANEWEMIDSAGYSLPYNGQTVNLSYHRKNNISIDNYLIQGYLSTQWHQQNSWGRIYSVVGLRYHYQNFTHENLISPRFRIALKPNGNKDILFRFSTGVYYQPPFFREFLSSTNGINSSIKSQKSIHFVFGNDWNFELWHRPFKLLSEAYYKSLSHLIPFELDNIRIQYLPELESKGYAYGLDLRLSGEFVPSLESWFSLSYLYTKEDVLNDGHGYLFRPTDQRISANIFFQDYLPGNDSYKFHLNFNFGTGFPYGPPHFPRFMATGRMPAYEQVDIGFSKKIVKNKLSQRKLSGKIPFKSIWLSAEIYNLFGANNVVSYYWVRVRPNQALLYNTISDIYPIPNFSIGRIFNFKLEIKF